MPTSLTLDTVRSTDGRLVLTATGEIDLSNVEPFSQALTDAVADADSWRRRDLARRPQRRRVPGQRGRQCAVSLRRTYPCYRPSPSGPDLRHQRLQ